jgi:hypothetical protein
MCGAGGSTAFGSGAFIRRRVFLSYHHAADQRYYDAFSATFHDAYELISDTSLERRIDSDDVNYVLRRIRESYITGSSCTIVLVGAETWRRKYVDWEIDATLQKGHGLIGVRLPTLYPMADGLYPVPDRLFDNVNSGYAVWTDWATITQGRHSLISLIETANSRNPSLIDNSRPRRMRNT